MSIPKIGEILAKALEDNVAIAESMTAEAKFQIKTTLQSQIEKMELVTKQEFEASRAALDRALKRVEQLEHKLGAPKD